MNNFGRVLAISLRHRLTVAASLFCSLAVAVLWVGNIAPLYWVVDVVMLDKSLPQWLEEGQDDRRVRVTKLSGAIAEQTAKLKTAPAEQARKLRRELANLQEQEARLKRQLLWYEPLRRFAERYLPTTPFDTLLVV